MKYHSGATIAREERNRLSLISMASFVLGCIAVALMCFDLLANPAAAERAPYFAWTAMGLATVSGIAAGINKIRLQNGPRT